ncbi:3'-5' exonuclease [Flavobacterium johnsoniae]|jgi:DNA polymerase-3 subunit epsilon|uniref:DNA polymerase-3 subunit epsilon n=2 Tax=Flavobacterium johnsoniae TaxID=986 RepID=A0A1M5P3Z2_FLAJO|nr:3'-5' exonuclease [Flavobacterium johnsoniae]ABQ05506.1 DNA polymerase III, epsilon subunit [Flavobacterium johnsoniae UW101]OXE96764.1 DNA polymerase III subunit epsilon [Flavobacterium johnsoniae UW101]WQG82692.1 3'-5' exonuclease [Flavobacterium johnsoniae UW101]SHG96468.1 DNA polymerase-3 subunit epsilon [Flavobacterium johnsoniae]SHL55217.1 DNA polymerase-3 subunit epsilon [Flavobacterium johnsoniae]
MGLFSFWKKEENLFDESITIEETRFVVLDTETTGFDYENDRILCIGALALQNGVISVQDSFEIYLHQDHYDKSTAQIHGILKDLLVKRPTELEALQQFLDFLGDSIIIAHHTVFDVTMINKALERNGLPQLTNKTLDTAYLYKKTLIQSHLFERKDHYTLDDLADKFDISKKDRHTALGDAYITAIAFLKIVKKLREKKAVSLNQLFKN